MRKPKPPEGGKTVRHMTRLLRSDCSGPGITRRGRGRGFEYLYADGGRVTDPASVPELIAGEWLDVKIGKRRREIGRLQQ